MNDISSVTIAPMAELYTALAKAQAMFLVPKRTKPVDVKRQDGTKLYTFNYAPMDEILAAIRDGLAANGLSQGGILAKVGDQTVVRTIIRHESGQQIECDYPVFPTKEGGQGFTSGVTYARRNGLCLALGIAPADEDDDGNAAEEQFSTPVSRGHPAQDTGQSPSLPRPPLKPIQPLPEQPVYDPETGEVGPHPIPVPLSEDGRTNWTAWGRKLIDALQRSKELAEGEEWIAQCEDAITNCKQSAPNAYRAVEANIRVMRERFNAPDFMSADDPLRPMTQQNNLRP